MINRTHRFHGHASLRYVYQHGRTWRNQVMSVRVATNDRRSTYRCAVVVSKKVSKSAVVRNRIRRRLYELVRLETSLEGQPLDLVITIFQANVATMPAADLRSAFQDVFGQAKVGTHAIIEKKES
jgi:ribonuclease P protein component